MENSQWFNSVTGEFTFSQEVLLKLPYNSKCKIELPEFYFSLDSFTAHTHTSTELKDYVLRFILRWKRNHLFAVNW